MFEQRTAIDSLSYCTHFIVIIASLMCAGHHAGCFKCPDSVILEGENCRAHFSGEVSLEGK